MSLVTLPDELLLQIIDLVTSSYSKPVDISSRAFYDWTDRSKREATISRTVTRDLLWLSLTCKKLHRLAIPRAWETVRLGGVRVSHKPPVEQRNLIKRVYGYVYDHQRLLKELRTFSRADKVILADIWEYTTLFRREELDESFPHVRQLRVINSSLGLGAFQDLYSAFPQLEELCYELGAYETYLRETRNVWDPSTFGTMLLSQASTLTTLVLTRADDVLYNGHRQQQSHPVNLSAMKLLKHVRIAEIFLFCRVQIRHHQLDDVADYLPNSLETLSVYYDEPREVRFEWDLPPGLEPSYGVERWPQWPTALATAKGTGLLPLVSSVTVLEKARSQPARWPYLEDDENVPEEEPPNRELTVPGHISNVYNDAGIMLTVLLNVDKGRVL